MDGGSKYLVTVLGPTAVGKTDVAVKLAQWLDTEVISADSRQIYREMPIGTAQPGQAALDAIPHHFIASHSVQESLTASDFAEQALQLLNRLYQAHDHAILAGGSGFYVKALLEGLDEIPEVSPGIREALNREFEEEGLEALTFQLREVDPKACLQIDLKNPVRVIRALEVYKGTGFPLSSFWQSSDGAGRPFQTIKLGLCLPRQQLYQIIEERCEKMLEKGLLAEVESLYPYRHLQALQTVGYQEFFDCLEGKCSYEEAVALFKQRTRQYAKRQLTWFRRDPEIKWFVPNEIDAMQSYIEEQFEQR